MDSLKKKNYTLILKQFINSDQHNEQEIFALTDYYFLLLSQLYVHFQVYLNTSNISNSVCVFHFVRRFFFVL